MKDTSRIFFFVFLPVFILLALYKLTGNNLPVLRNFLTAVPILVVLVIMTVFHVGGQEAGPLGLLTGGLTAWLAFGLTPQVLWVSQAKGVLLSLFVIFVFLPALFLYNIVNRAGGIQALALALENLISDRGLLLIVIAWAFSAMLEGLAGFGLPVAIVSPMLAGLGVEPVLAVAAVAVGHAWSVTFGDMGVIFQTLTGLVKVDPTILASTAALILGIAGLLCGLAVAHLFKRLDRWPAVFVLAGLMGLVQYVCVVSRLSALASFLAGLAGLLGGVLLNRLFINRKGKGASPVQLSRPLAAALASYGGLALVMAVTNLVNPIRLALGSVVWRFTFPVVQTLENFQTAAKIQSYQPLLHPGAAILLAAFLSYAIFRQTGLIMDAGFGQIAAQTFHAAFPAMIGILTMVGLSTLMDHAGMNLTLAKLLSSVFYGVYPLVSPLMGMLGAFATGSNNNSNVLFASLQEGIALILKLSPAVIVSAQTAGGSLGSMIAPAKIIVGLSTVNQRGRDGDVLRLTIPYGLAIGVLMGLVALILVKFL